MNKNLSNLIVLSSVLMASATALAQPVNPYPKPAAPQPAPQPTPEPGPGAPDPDAPAPDRVPSAGPGAGENTPRSEAEEQALLEQQLSDLEERAEQMSDWNQPSGSYSPQPKASPPPPFPEMRAPQLLSVPTAHLLPAAVVYSSASVDTGGSIGGSLRVGLGDVGEFGLETSPLIRMIAAPGRNPETIQPLVFATFKMGVSEGRLFDEQPALALGFRKSFSREIRGHEIRAAAIEMTASKSFGKISLHGGGVFWDAELDELGAGSVSLHDEQLGVKRQIRPFGGIEAEPFENAQLLVDVAWVPLFRPGENAKADRLALRPSLSWGIRYVLSKRVSLESGVRVPDIGDANLLDAQIFGQLTFATDRIRRGLGISTTTSK